MFSCTMFSKHRTAEMQYNYVADENDIIMVIYTAASLVHMSCCKMYTQWSRVDIEHNKQQKELWGDVDCKLGNREKEAIKLSQQAQ